MTRYATYICGGPEPVQFWKRKCNPMCECPDEANHTLCPSGYTAWFDWMEEMRKTHKQVRCPTCQCFSIWIPKPESKTRRRARA